MAGSVVAPTGRLSARQIAQYAAAAGFSGEALVMAVAVALAESGGRPGVINTANRDGSRDRGVWQINTVHGGSDAELLNPATNASYAYRISSGGSDWSPWVVYKTGAYRTHLATARAAVTEAGAVGGFGRSAGGIPDPLDVLHGAGDLAEGIAEGIVTAPFDWFGGTLTSGARDLAGGLAVALLPVGLTVVFTVGALGLMALGLSRLTERTPQELFNTATKVTGAGGIAKAVI